MNLQPDFKCPASMAPHVQKIMQGEYDVPYHHPRPIILDVGANVGGFTFWAARRWPGCEIHCYEPVTANFELLKHNIGILLRGDAGARHCVHLHNVAIGDPGHMRMFLGLNNCGEASFFDLGEQSTACVEVMTQAPDVMPAAQILKLDTEGCEVEILSRLPAIDFDVIMIEYHSERHRRNIDDLLANYALVGGYVRHLHRGIVKYMHERLLGSPATRSGDLAEA